MFDEEVIITILVLLIFSYFIGKIFMNDKSDENHSGVNWPFFIMSVITTIYLIVCIVSVCLGEGMLKEISIAIMLVFFVPIILAAIRYQITCIARWIVYKKCVKDEQETTKDENK